jgi:hypothetical protein
VARVSTAFKRALLRSINADGVAAGLSLLQSLTAALRGRVTETQTGAFLSGTAGNGHSVQFLIPQGGLTPETAVETVGQLFDEYEASRTALIAAGVATPTDGQILTEMLDRLVAVKSFTSCFTGLRTAGA